MLRQWVDIHIINTRNQASFTEYFNYNSSQQMDEKHKKEVSQTRINASKVKGNHIVIDIITYWQYSIVSCIRHIYHILD